MKKYLLSAILLIAIILPAGSVLNEKNLAKTLSVLRIELENTFNKQQRMISRLKVMSEVQHRRMVDIMERSSKISLMLYSQQRDYTFDLTYACHEATSLYREFSVRQMPYEQIKNNLRNEIERYERLIHSLKVLPPSLVKNDSIQMLAVKLSQSADSLVLSAEDLANLKDMALVPDTADLAKDPIFLDKQGQEDRKACLKYAEDILALMKDRLASIEVDNEHYDITSKRLKELYDYANERYHAIQQSIFVNGEDSYLKQIKQFRSYVRRAQQDVEDKYENKEFAKVRSDWRGPIVFGVIFFVVFYLIVATILSNLFVRIGMRSIKRFQTEQFRKKKMCYILAGTVLIFALALMILKLFMYNNFFIMASELFVEFAWLATAILVSLLIRLDGSQIKSGFRIYTPIMLMGFIIIVFRVIFIPNRLVSLVFPPILLLFTLWQWNVIHRHNNNIPRSDIFYTWISLALMAISTILSLSGYVLLAVQIFIWWLFQLAAIQTITCICDLLKMYEKKYLVKRKSRYLVQAGISGPASAADTIQITWFYDFLMMVVVPILGIMSFLYSIYWASDVFDLSGAVVNIYSYRVVITKICTLSLFRFALSAMVFFICRYLIYLIKMMYRHYKYKEIRKKNDGVVLANNANLTLFNNLVMIVVWGVYFIFILKLFEVPATGISIVTAGLATGVGFAMKDLIENFFYGLSLMTGRVRVGDIIECDGIRGKVDSITYQSTQIATIDGCVIAFLNSALFSKNFKNLTRNHSYELVKVPVGVAYGVDVEKVRTLLSEGLQELNGKDKYGRNLIDEKHGVNVYFQDFGDNSVNLNVVFWVLVAEQFGVVSKAKEIIYNTLNQNNIEIPYPQRDVYIRQLPNENKE